MNITIVNIISILLGCISGISIFFSLLLRKKCSYILKPTRQLINTLEKDNIDEVQRIIQYHYMKYIKTSKKEKTNIISITQDMAETISKHFNPDSTNPMFEIKIKDALLFLDHYVNKIEDTIYALKIDGIEDLKINTIIDIIIFGKKVKDISSGKIVKILIKTYNILFMIKNIIYIPYWIKKGTSRTINKSFTNILIYSYFVFVGNELIYIYSK